MRPLEGVGCKASYAGAPALSPCTRYDWILRKYRRYNCAHLDVQVAAGAFIMKLPKGANGQARATPPAEQPLHVFTPFLPDSGIVAGHRRGQYTVLVLIRFCFPPRVSSSSRRLIRE